MKTAEIRKIIVDSFNRAVETNGNEDTAYVYGVTEEGKFVDGYVEDITENGCIVEGEFCDWEHVEFTEKEIDVYRLVEFATDADYYQHVYGDGKE